MVGAYISVIITAQDTVSVLIVIKIMLRIKNGRMRESIGRKCLCPREGEEGVVLKCAAHLLTAVISRVSVASGPIQKSFLEIMDPSHGGILYPAKFRCGSLLVVVGASP